MSSDNEALWLDSPRATLRAGPAPDHTPGPGEVVVRTEAVAVNPVDTMSPLQRRLAHPWLRFPAVLGTDVAGVVDQIGQGVTHVREGDRVVGLATGQEQHRNSPSHCAFQRRVVLEASLTTPVPSGIASWQAVVLPLGVATASAGLFEAGQLGLVLPGTQAVDRRQTVLVWGGSTSVGTNAIQLALSSGYRVITTASPHNHAALNDVGAVAAFDYHDPTVVDEIRADLEGRSLAGVLAIGAGSLPPALRVAARRPRRTRVACTSPTPATAAARLLTRPVGITVSTIWGGTIARNQIGAAIFTGFLPAALASGRYRPAPVAEVVGHGLATIPDALARLQRGVSARKIVVTVGD